MSWAEHRHGVCSHKAKSMVTKTENEQNNESVSVRQRDAEIDKQELGEMKLEQLIELVKKS